MEKVISISLDADTVSSLQAQDFALYALKGVDGATGGQPLVWFLIPPDELGQNTIVTWENDFTVFNITSNFTISQGQTISSSVLSFNEEDIRLGQTGQISQGGGLSVNTEGVDQKIRIKNDADRSYMAGIASGIANDLENPSSKLVVMPIGGDGAEVNLTPIDMVLLMFATREFNAGAVIVQAFSPGFLVDVTGVASRTVSYSFETGWSNNGESWGEKVENQAELAPILLT